MTILSQFDYADSSVALLPEEMSGRIRRLDEYSMRSVLGNKIGFARIDDFKGLENEAIILVDLPAMHNTDRCAAMYYWAMSRARSVLSIVSADFSGA